MKHKIDIALEKSAQRIEITLSELIAALFVTAPAMTILTAYAVDAAGWPIEPTAMLLLVTIEVLLAIGWVWPSHRMFSVRVDIWEMAGFVVVFIGLFGYIFWLARPTYLPLTQSGDLVHHLSLIDFVQNRHSLVHDPSLEPYLGEMVNYPPGSHVLTALVADWLGTTGVRVLHSLGALLIAVKAGTIYNILLNLIQPPRRNPAVAVAGTLLLLLAHGYFLSSWVFWGFYAQAVSETFVVAMLWALFAWERRPLPSLLAFISLCGIAVWLSFPLWLPVPLAVLIGLLVVRNDLSLNNKIRQCAYTLIPIAIITAMFAVGRLESASQILRAQGGVVLPSLELYGRRFLGLVILGVAVSLRNRRSLALLFFAGAAIALFVGLYIFDIYHHVTSFYLAYKTFYLLFYPMVLFAALGIDTLWQLPKRWLPAAWTSRWQTMAVILPVVVLAMSLQCDLPSRPSSAISEAVYRVGIWAKENLPTACVDYVVNYWVTAYWLHVDILGNPRAAPRATAIVEAFDRRRASTERWSDPGGLPYAIVQDLSTVPPEVRSGLRLLYEYRPAAVVQRSDEFTCRDDTLPIDQVKLVPRGWTLAQPLDLSPTVR